MRYAPLLLALAVAGAVTALAPVWAAETFVLKNGDTVEGTVIRAGGNTVTIKLVDRGMVQAPIADVRRVEIAIRGGKAVIGTLSAWAEGTYLLDTDEGLVAVKDGQIVDDGAGAAAVATNTSRPGQGSDLKAQFETFLADMPPSTAANLEKDEIFERFLEWQGQQLGR